MSNQNLIHALRSNGGTALTNFYDADLDVYEDAIKAYGDPDLIASNKPVPPMTKGCSLHFIGDSKKDLGDFWRIFNKLKSVHRASKEVEQAVG